MKYILVLLVVFSQVIASCDAERKAIPSETIDYPFEGRTAEFQKARFGALLCFGIYSQLGGEWEGERYYGTSEWLMKRVPISPADYKNAALVFNPTEFSAGEWAKNLNDAGIKYVAFTSKFHDGFAMWHSKASDFNIVDASPYKKDLLKELIDAFQKADIKVGLYYSQYQDWYEPGGGNSLHPKSKISLEKYDNALMLGNASGDKEKHASFPQYMENKVIPQLNEILSNYGDIFLIWFDTPGNMGSDYARKLADMVHEKQANCLVSARIGYNLGDYLGMKDSQIPAVVPAGQAWETPMTHNESWGYSKLDNDYKSAKEIIQMLARLSSKGGNLLLNIGPDGSGKMPEQAVKILKQVGGWLELNGESIYGTAGSPIPSQPWGVSTLRPGKIYLHVFDLPRSGELFLPADMDIKQAYSLDGLDMIEYGKVQDGVILDVSQMKESPNTVIVLEYSGEIKPTKDQHTFIVNKDFKEITIEAPLARMHGGATIGEITYSQYWAAWKHKEFASMSNKEDQVSWSIDVKEAGTYRVFVEYMCEEENAGREGYMRISNTDYPFKVLRTTGIYDKWSVSLPLKQSIGPVELETGEQEISIIPREDGEDYFINLIRVILEAEE